MIWSPCSGNRCRRFAVERGPIVYCAEWPDVEGGKALDLVVDGRADLTPAVFTDHVRRLLDDPSRLATMGARALDRAKPDAAERFARLVAEVAAG